MRKGRIFRAFTIFCLAAITGWLLSAIWFTPPLTQEEGIFAFVAAILGLVSSFMESFYD